MLFSSVIFVALFLPAVLLIYYTLLRKNRNLQNGFLMLASLFFYAWGEPWFVFIMIASILGNYTFGLLIDRNRFKGKAVQRLILTLMLTFNLSILFVFKYLSFVEWNLNYYFDMNLTVHSITLPIGISFFTFQAISYVIDVYREKEEVQTNLLNVGLYISFFPQLIAGPIIRYETIAQQIMGRKESIEDFSQGVCRFIAGFGKKVLLANHFASVADAAFSMSPDDLSVSFAWVGALAYTFQIFFDFAGYSDMAIGLGRMFGFHFPENFNYPYISKSVTEFWRRWHISLGTWFRDYVYFPLGGSRVDSKARLVFNLFVVWLLTGLWHGANWTFIWWGLLYFVFIALEKVTGIEKRALRRTERGGASGMLISFVCHFYTLVLVMAGWVLFRADSLWHARYYLKAMFLMGGNVLNNSFTAVYLTENRYIFLAGFFFSVPAARWIRKKLDEKPVGDSLILSGLYAAAYMAVFLSALSFLVKGTYNPFIYFNF